MRGRAFAWALFVACLQWGALGAAQGKDRNYDALIREALTEYRSSNWAEARALFEQAHAQRPNARTLRGLGLVSFELREYVRAATELRAALEDARNSLTAAQREEVKRVLDRAERFIGRVSVVLVPQSADLLVDGSPVDSHELVLDVGAHELRARADGYVEQQRHLSIAGGQQQTVRLELMPSSASGSIVGEVSLAPAAARSEDAAGEGPPRTLQWVTFAGFTAVAITGGVLLGLAAADKRSVENAPLGTSLGALESKHDRVPAFSIAGGSLLAAGLAGAGACVAWILLTGASASDSDSGANEQKLSLRIEGSSVNLHGVF